MITKNKTGFVVSPHSVEVVQRTDGTIAKYCRHQMAGQEHLRGCFNRAAPWHGVQLTRNIEYAEGYMRLTPALAEVL